MKWIKRDSLTTVEEVVERNTGTNIKDFVTVNETKIYNLDVAGDKVIESIANGEEITIFGDYDADGVTASAILWSLISILRPEKPANIRLPRRFSEGYGISMKACDEISNGMVITVDNGIAAVEQIKNLKEKGISVVVLDHHLAGEILPNADVIVDPHVYKTKVNDFEDFCGAGLAYKISEYILSKMPCNDKVKARFLSYANQLSAIGTVCDVMPLVKDNRNIVIKGLEEINKNPCKGLSALMKITETSLVDETTCGFLLGPIINACGRLLDDGALLAFDVLTAGKRIGSLPLIEAAKQVVDLNRERREVAAEALESAERIISDNCLYGEYPLIVVDESIGEGIVGIVAGKLAEKYKVPTIVLTHQEGNVLKGSARSYGDVHVKKMFDYASEHIIKYGGHAGAAGLSVSRENVSEMYNKMHEFMGNYSINEEDIVEYDLEIEAKDIEDTLERIKKYAPFGEGNPKIIFKIKEFALSPRLGLFSRFMGEKDEHIKLFANGFSAVGFDLAYKYDEAASKTCSCVGMLSENIFRGKTEAQVEMLDFEYVEAKQYSELQRKLLERMKNL